MGAPDSVSSAAWQTFSFIPGYSFVDAYGYPVKVRTFEDQTEFRELPGRLLSRELVYDFGRVDSAIAFQIQSFYLAHNTFTPFLARDHANGFYYVCRFDGPCEILRTGNRFIVGPLTLAVVRDTVDQPDQGGAAGGSDQEGAGEGGAGT